MPDMTIIFIILTLIFPFIFKYQYIITNQFTQIPIINSILDPTYMLNDWYVNVSRGFGPRTIFAYYMAFLSKLIGLPGAFFINYLIYIFLVIWSAFTLSQMLFKDKYISLLTTLFVLFGATYGIGGNILITRDFSAPQLPLALIIAALVYMLQEKIYKSLILIVIAAYLHPLLGWEGGALILGSWGIHKILNKEIKTKLYSVIKIWLLFILATLPLFLTYFSEITDTAISNNQVLINILAYSRNPHHYISSTWPVAEHTQYLLFLAFSFFIGYKLLPHLDQPVRKIIKLIFIMTGLILLLNLFGFIFTEIMPIYQIVAAQVFRNNLFAYFLSAVILYGGSLILIKSGKLPHFLFPVLFVFIQPLLSLKGKTDFLALLFLFLFGWLFFRKKFIVSLFLLLVAFSLANYHIPLRFTSAANINPGLTKLTDWANSQTLPDSIFIVPPEMEEFRLLANRTVVADWKAFPFQKSGMVEWYYRMCDIGNIQNCQNGLIQRDAVVKGYLTLTENDVRRLADIYDADYLITTVKYPSLNQVYTKDYYIYQMSVIN